MKNIVIKLEVLPGVKHDIDIPGEELVKALNLAWDVEDRIEFAMKLDLRYGEGKDKLSVLGKVLRSINLDEITVSELLILDDVISTMRKRIDRKKSEIRKDG